TPQEALILYSFFKEKGPLIEFKFGRDLESKRMFRFGWVSYKDEKVSEKLLADEIHTLPEPLDFDIKVQKSTETPEEHSVKMVVPEEYNVKMDVPEEHKVKMDIPE
ncbi:31366_t:CDS:2, partial [Gigaspora margarita]